MQLFPASPLDRDEIGRFQQIQVWGHRLSRHCESVAQFAQRLSVLGVQTVDQLAAAWVGESLEHFVYLLRGHVRGSVLLKAGYYLRICIIRSKRPACQLNTAQTDQVDDCS